jgi:hypothetical protein
MFKKTLLLLAVLVASASAYSVPTVGDIPQPTCYPCTSVN